MMVIWRRRRGRGQLEKELEHPVSPAVQALKSSDVDHFYDFAGSMEFNFSFYVRNWLRLCNSVDSEPITGNHGWIKNIALKFHARRSSNRTSAVSLKDYKI